jgi:hypothetical protein
MGRVNQQPKNKTTIHRSIFYRIDWDYRDHQKDHFQRNSQSVFDHLEWLLDGLHHQKDTSAMNSDVMDCIITEQLPCSNLKGKRLVDYLQYSQSYGLCSMCSG